MKKNYTLILCSVLLLRSLNLFAEDISSKKNDQNGFYGYNYIQKKINTNLVNKEEVIDDNGFKVLHNDVVSENKPEITKEKEEPKKEITKRMHVFHRIIVYDKISDKYYDEKTGEEIVINKKEENMDFYNYSLINIDNQEIPMANYKGKVVMIVNTATACGFTPQYEPLEAIYEKYHDKGLEIIDVPCNQFGYQAPGTDEEIKNFCQVNYHTNFVQIKKSEVNGPGALSLFKYLKKQQGFKGFGEGKQADFMREHLRKIDPDYENNSEIKWNFTKFIIDRSGKVVKRFEPTDDLSEVEQYIASLL